MEEQAFAQLINMNKNSQFVLHLSDIPEKVSFIIIQVHTYIYSVSLSYDQNVVDKVSEKCINGTNIGLFLDANNSKIKVYITNKNSFIVHSLIAAVAYTANGKYLLLIYNMYIIFNIKILFYF
jgi:hypothetical protein